MVALPGKSTIFVSENGAGKTTILSALRMVLERDLSSLRQIPCESIFIKFVGHQEIEIRNNDLKPGIESMVSNYVSMELAVSEEFWATHNINDFINLVSKNQFNDINNNDLISQLYYESPYSEQSFKNDLRKLMDSININGRNNEVSEEISKILGDKEIIFLPTYRRVEKNLEIKKDDEAKTRPLRRREIKLHHDGISYGLKDVEERLKELTLEIERTSNLGYRSLSARMLSDLIHHGNSKNIMNNIGELPTIEDLERFLSRVEKPSSTTLLSTTKGRRKKIALIDSMKDLYEKNEVMSSPYLYYFLTQLADVIKQTKEQEFKIESFVNICNKYLESSGDSKMLRFDQQTLTVIVSDSFTGENISLSDLSSGEKQVISLMAIKHLSNDREKIILIDEPELSLSLKWQRMILPDLSSGDNVSQLIAITHSPFIFENDLSNSVSPMKVQRLS